MSRFSYNSLLFLVISEDNANNIIDVNNNINSHTGELKQRPSSAVTSSPTTGGVVRGKLNSDQAAANLILSNRRIIPAAATAVTAGSASTGNLHEKHQFGQAINNNNYNYNSNIPMGYGSNNRGHPNLINSSTINKNYNIVYSTNNSLEKGNIVNKGHKKPNASNNNNNLLSSSVSVLSDELL